MYKLANTNRIPDTAYPLVGYDVSNLLPRHRIDFCGAMTRSSTKELFTPFDNLERNFRSKRRLFKTPSLVESNLPEFDQFTDIEEQLEEEATEIMTETMEQYMSKTYRNCGSGVARPKINDKTHFELKGKFLKELRDNTFSGSKHEDANEHIEKVLEIIDLFYIPEEVILFYNGLDVPTRQILDSKGAIPTKTAADAKVAIQEMAEATGPGFYQQNNGNSSYPDRRQTVEESLTKFMAESAKRHEENSSIIKEI
ncbi:hypothetical protein Tco_0216783 [Tanacetum coccineum]